MASIDTNLAYNTSYYALNIKRKNLNAYKSIDAYSEAHAASTTPSTKSVSDVKNLSSSELIELLQLSTPENRLSILSQLKHSDLVRLLPLIEKKNLLIGLKFFKKEKLLQFIYNMPKEDLIKIASKLYPDDKLLEAISPKQLRKFMDSSKIDNKQLIKVFDTLPRHVLAQIQESITGQPVNNKDNEAAIISNLSGFKKDQLAEGIKSLSNKDLLLVTKGLVTNNDKLLGEFSQTALFEPIEKQQKGSIIEGMGSLDPEKLMKLVGQLPDNLLAQVTTLVPTEKLVEVLQKDYSDLLASLM